MKITSQETLLEVIEIIADETPGHDLSALSEQAVKFWVDTKKGLVLEGMEGLERNMEAYGVECPVGFTPSEFNEQFLNACGFAKYEEPIHFYHGGSGDCMWLTSFFQGEGKTMTDTLQDWVNETNEASRE